MPLPLLFGSAASGILAVASRFLIPYLITRVFISLGITVASFVGASLLIDYIESQVMAGFGSIALDIGAVLIIAGFLDAFNLIFNSWVAAFNIRSLRGSFKRFKLL